MESYTFYISVKLNLLLFDLIIYKKIWKKIAEIVLPRAKGYTGSGVLSDNDVQNNSSSTT